MQKHHDLFGEDLEVSHFHLVPKASQFERVLDYLDLLEQYLHVLLLGFLLIRIPCFVDPRRLTIIAI